jgi:uncharacterized Zn ribbon protein
MQYIPLNDGNIIIAQCKKTQSKQHYENLEYIYVWFTFNDIKEKVICGSSQCSISIRDQFNAQLNETDTVS